jgi:hypothetical protein
MSVVNWRPERGVSLNDEKPEVLLDDRQLVAISDHMFGYVNHIFSVIMVFELKCISCENKSGITIYTYFYFLTLKQ